MNDGSIDQWIDRSHQSIKATNQPIGGQNGPYVRTQTLIQVSTEMVDLLELTLNPTETPTLTPTTWEISETED